MLPNGCRRASSRIGNRGGEAVAPAAELLPRRQPREHAMCVILSEAKDPYAVTEAVSRGYRDRDLRCGWTCFSSTARTGFRQLPLLPDLCQPE